MKVENRGDELFIGGRRVDKYWTPPYLRTRDHHPHLGLGNVEAERSTGLVEAERSLGLVETERNLGLLETERSLGFVEAERSLGHSESKKSLGRSEAEISLGYVNAEKRLGRVEAEKSLKRVNAEKSLGCVETEKRSHTKPEFMEHTDTNIRRNESLKGIRENEGSDNYFLYKDLELSVSCEETDQ